MTKDRLRSLSYKELSKIAEHGNINVLEDMDKESLISVVFDALEEERLDREGNNNLTIQVEAKKYTVSQDEELYLDFAADVELSQRYEETSLVLMLRDPSWVHCYWDIESRILTALETNPQYRGLILRVSELAEFVWTKNTVIDWFDIPVQFHDLSRYINLPRENSYYGVDMYAQLKEKEVLITRSNIVASSRDYVASPRGTDNAYCDHLIRLSGFSTDIGRFPGTGYDEADNPQRIIGDQGDRP